MKREETVRERTVKRFLECEAKRAEARAAALTDGKSEEEAREIAHDAAKAHWNTWAEGLLTKQRDLEAANLGDEKENESLELSQWTAEKFDYLGTEPAKKDSSDQVRSWREAATADFSGCYLRVMSSKVMLSEPKTDTSSIVDSNGAVIDMRGYIFPGIASFNGSSFSGDVWFDGANFRGDVQFRSATFLGEARFELSIFLRDSRFNGARFSGIARFDVASFSQRVWFSEVEFAKGASFAKATFSDEVNFDRLDCAGLAVFDDVIFDKPAVFDKAIFSGGSSFSRSSFLGSGYFIKSAFADTATFNNAVFSDVVFFDGTSFAQTVLFNNARIRGKSRFKEAKFSGDAHFNLTRFGDTASFVEALFARYTRFNGSTFSAKAYFKHTTFSGIVSFEGVNFFGETHFSSARFSQDCNFETSNFYASARFDEAEFEGMSSFDRAVFDRDAFFSGATFLKKTSLRSIKFGSNSKVDFKGIKVERAFDLGGAAFSEVPEFNQADFKQQPDLHNVQLWPLPFWRRGDPSLIGPYRHIKRLAKDHDCDNEHIGLKGELRSRRWSIDKAYWASSWLGLLYDGVSDCGRSIWRPLGIWFGSVVVFADIRAADQPEGWNCSVPFIKALFLSGRNALVLFSGSRDARITQAYQCLFGGAHEPEIPDAVSIVESFVQVPLSAVLIFLFLLAVKNRFKIK